ncbi:hypothetical protein RINTHM_1790 [Richelia intracellularis HM01]|uniref:hypothetical protein n=1 Tax=Richelia intracellularis TaxID=1164990 RepID=UPI0002B5E5E1|nr:hypothetical protein [Richelia intracellularis]CCH64659.1 hypothetical protein RINTHM_1790 [Richelia intracellularis HM01]
MQLIDNFNEIANALNQPTDFSFKLPDPEDEKIPEQDFLKRVEVAWQVCDRFDLQTEIWRGRILRTVRDRDKVRSNGRNTSFSNWLKEREISKSQAYSLIQLANSADTLLKEDKLQPSSINNFSKRAFVETAKAVPEVQIMVSEAAQKGEHITRREVRQISDEWTAMTSDLLPEQVKVKVADNTLPNRYIVPLVKELEKLPESYQESLKEEIKTNPDVDTLKQLTIDARNLAKYLKASNQVQALDKASIDIESALIEAQRVNCLNIAADLVNQASQMEQTIAKLYMNWKRISNLADRLYVDTGVSTPNLRLFLDCLEPLGGEVINLDISGTSNWSVRLQIQEIE